MECPHCGFMNLLDSGECVRCRKPLPEAPAGATAEPADELDLSEVKIERVPEEAPEAPRFPDAGEVVDISSPTVEPVAPLPAAPTSSGEDTETSEVPFTPAQPEPTAPAPARVPKDEASATYEGSDPELKELSRFFHEVRQERDSRPEGPALGEEIPPTEPAPPEPAEKPTRRLGAGAPPTLFATEAESASERSEDSDSFVPEFKETMLPGLEDSSPSMPGKEPAPAALKGGQAFMPAQKGTRRAVAKESLLGPRLQAALLDGAIHLLILALLYFGAVFAVGLSPQGLPWSDWLLRVALPLALVMSLIFTGYQVFFTATAGQTPGQMLFQLRVEDEVGDSPLLIQALLRSLILLACILPLGLGLLLILRDPEGLSLPDKISRTRVTRIARDLT